MDPILEKSESLEVTLCLVPLHGWSIPTSLFPLSPRSHFPVACDGVTLGVSWMAVPVKVFIENGSLNDEVSLAFSIVIIELFHAAEQSFSRLHAMPNSTAYIHVGHVLSHHTTKISSM